MDIKEMIPVGHDRAATRRSLRDWYGAKDRSLREAIERENSRGEVAIINIGEGDGYFIYGGEEDDPYYDRYTHQIKARIKALEDKLQAMGEARKKCQVRKHS